MRKRSDEDRRMTLKDFVVAEHLDKHLETRIKYNRTEALSTGNGDIPSRCTSPDHPYDQGIVQNQTNKIMFLTYICWLRGW